MRATFVRLAIAGFKSFAEPVVVEILPGLTGIVGPNGCGKSNVTDALRWAMGEASARSLRGGEMDDVIFAGTTARASRNLAEVIVTLEADPAAGGFGPPFGDQAELAVARRIERGAGSHYRVNGREVRARDVQVLFADLASGARSSAMVSQGRVSALVSARPEERRLVLEEAAGITGLHARRAEAETRLRSAEGNLARADERRAMLEGQLSGLERQAKQAARYRTLSTSVGEAEALVLAMGRARAEAGVRAAAAGLAAAQAAVVAAAAGSGAASVAAREAQERLPDLRAEEGAARTALERARVAQEGVDAEVARARAGLAAAAARREQAVRDLGHAEQILTEVEAAETRLVAEAERLATEAEGHPADVVAAREAVAAAAAHLAAAEAAAQGVTERSAALTAQAEASARVVSAAEGRARRAGEAMARLEAERARALQGAPDSADVAAAQAAAAAARGVLAEARGRLEAAERARGAAQAAAGSARERASHDEAGRVTLAAEVSGLSQVLAVRDGERWPPMVDRVEVLPGLEAALGAAFGEDLAAAADPGAARYWRELPLQATEGAQGAEGESLLGRVRAPSALGRALAGVRLVGSEAEGDRGQAGLRPGETLVSEAGAVWRWDGYTVRAGAPTGAAVRLQQRNRLSALRGRLAEAEAAAAAARASRVASDGAEREAVATDAAARGALRAAEQGLERTRAAASGLVARAEQSAARLADVGAQIGAAAPELEEANVALAAALAERDGAPDVTAVRAEAERSRAALVAARGRERETARALEGLERAGSARVARLGVIGRERADGRMRAEDAGGRVMDLRARAAEAGAEAERLGGAPAAALGRAAAGEAELRAAQAGHRAEAAGLAEAEARAGAAGEAARGAELALYAAREGLVRADAAAAAAGLAWEAASAAVAERAGALALPEAPADVSVAAEERARARWQRLARERDEIGPVNLRAEIEAEALGGEIRTLVLERDELGTAIAKLRGGIGHLNREGRERLSEVFQQVDRHFQQLFARMFGGGRAHLALVGSDDPLQAGLEIYAQPPGKKLATLSLLSGGEQALTALSLVFAVFRCNPAPLCVLDEVDAPLDDANVERFCTLLADMVAETGTRFLVVTHHHLTMARMDRLYGVTMQERGVSRLLSVDLGVAVQMVEQVAAE